MFNSLQLLTGYRIRFTAFYLPLTWRMSLNCDEASLCKVTQNSLSCSQESYNILCNQKFPYQDHNNPPLVSILCQVNKVHILLPYLLNIHFAITLPSTSSSPKWPLLFRFINKRLEGYSVEVRNKKRSQCAAALSNRVIGRSYIGCEAAACVFHVLGSCSFTLTSLPGMKCLLE
jgi:hypothetical protein